MVVVLKPQDFPSDAKPLPQTPLTYEEFLDWADEDTYAEWVDGEIELMSPASAPHQRIALFLGKLLSEYGMLHNAGEAFITPFQMKLANVRRGREPDVLFVTTANLPRMRRNYLDGPADIAVEILSPESISRDRSTKYGEYEVGGVREYWLIDLEARQANFYVLDAEGRYQRAQADADGRYHSAVLPRFWINTAWLWQDLPPSLIQVLREWDG